MQHEFAANGFAGKRNCRLEDASSRDPSDRETRSHRRRPRATTRAQEPKRGRAARISSRNGGCFEICSEKAGHPQVLGEPLRRCFAYRTGRFSGYVGSTFGMDGTRTRQTRSLGKQVPPTWKLRWRQSLWRSRSRVTVRETVLPFDWRTMGAAGRLRGVLVALWLARFCP